MGKEWLNSLELGLKIFFEDPEDPNIDYLKKCYEEYIRYCKVLKQKALTKRQIYDSVKKYIKP